MDHLVRGRRSFPLPKNFALNLVDHQSVSGIRLMRFHWQSLRFGFVVHFLAAKGGI